MKILECTGLDTSHVAAAYRKVKEAIARGDFRAAQVKKLVHPGHGKFCRAKLDEADRLIFSLVRHGDEVCALMLEVVLNHDYDGSRFLRGAAIDESRITDCELAEAETEARPLRYLHPERGEIHLLDKPISFDDAQGAVYRAPAPLIVVGSGKTALIPEKLKHAEGEVLYVTHSAYLARNARDIYCANPPGFHPARPLGIRAGAGRVQQIQPERLAEGGGHARTARQTGTGRGDPARHPETGAGALASVRPGAGDGTAGEGVPRAGARRQAAPATPGSGRLPR